MSNQIRRNMKKVFSGVIFDVYQWEQEMYDGSFEIFEKLSRAGSVEVLAVTDEGKIVIQKQSQPDKDEPFLCPIGGRMEPDEPSLEAAKREMLEETGYEADYWELLHEVNPMSKIDWTMYVYIARELKKSAKQKLDAGERIELIEVTVDEFIDLVESGRMRRIEQDLRMLCVRARYDKTYNEMFKKKILGG